ncbi:Mu-like prophage tail sheath protein gpL [Faunimonas pinastri]|uniref:Mu-like prophage tail sheath protein gpL n=1 Tax=Faunimonas pinastri TaxID=1855383 RepID=A0A1H9GEP2_9HYPH|nr:phage tail sheath subtilisin-like domain-containing protein [Faunimonas pinastri]SEQ48595.1 Mu-like prophage tail sheath protein gpL [Faunimonas pinastri]
MTVAFNQMPSDMRTSLFFAEFNAGAAPYSGKSTQVLIGHMLTGGAATLGKLQILSSRDPNGLFGAGSTLADQAQFARWHDPVGAIYVLPVAEPDGAVKAAGTLTFTGPATASGTLVRYVAGEAVSIAVAAGDTATAIATRFAAAVAKGYTRFSRKMAFPVTATVAGAVVTLTARHGGSVGNQIRVESGLDGDEVDPTGVTVTVVQPTGGSGEVDMAAALALIGNAEATWIASPFNSVAHLDAVKDYLSNSGSGRWSPTVQKQGHYTTAMDGTLATLTAFGAVRNDPHATVLGIYNSPHPLWCVTAALNGRIALSKNMGAAVTEAIEIARPLQTLSLDGIRAPKDENDRWAQSDRQSLYENGIAGFTVAADGTVQLERICTTYQVNAYGTADTTWLDVETLAISMYVGRYLRQRVEETYPRHALKDENPRGIQGIVTPADAKATIVHAYAELCNLAGICENLDVFADALIVERSSDSCRLNAYIPVDVTNQLRVFAANVTVFLQFDNDAAASAATA